MSKVVNFIRDVRIELNKVAWPTKKQTLRYTVAVIAVSLVVAMFLGLWDVIFGFILNKII